ncbi:MAG: serine hydrolase [Gemmatimonadetes bacterium]|nr:serine hydrolase [Gemmatimonadota bacterium]
MDNAVSTCFRAVWVSCALVLLAVSVSVNPVPVFGSEPEAVTNGAEVRYDDVYPPVPSAPEAAPGRAEPQTAGSTARDRGIRVRSRAALVIDIQKGEVIYQKNATSPFPIASITKLMTAVTYMRMDPDLEKRVRISRQDVYRANWTRLRFGEQVSAKDLLYATLVASDNAAARALARASGLTIDAFADRMNATAASLGLANSRFTEPTGLDAGNVSTAVDCVALLWTALQDELLAEVLFAREHRFGTNRRTHTIRTTNRLVRDRVFQSQWESMGSKTGYIRRAGYCLVMRARGDSGDDIYAVILGGPTSRTRFTDMKRLLDWSQKDSGRPAGVDG